MLVTNNTFKGQSKFLLEAFKQARKKAIEAHRKNRLSLFLKKRADDEAAADAAAKQKQQSSQKGPTQGGTEAPKNDSGATTGAKPEEPPAS